MNANAGNPLCALVVDDEEDARSNLSHILVKAGLNVLTASDGFEALRLLESPTARPKAVLLDVSMPGMDGMEVLKRIKEIDDSIPIILITGHANVRQSVEAMRDGAYDYLVKPFDNNEVARITLRALSEGQVKKGRAANGVQAEYVSLFESMGPSDAIARITADVHRVAKSDFSVLIMGETGAGKELLATAIHRSSVRRNAPFVTVDCGAIPETLMESEFFGHEKGSFTGADRQKQGKFEAARGGTLFLDEIGNLPLASQAKLLRSIQSRVIHRVGGNDPIDVDFRLIAATNRNVRAMVQSGEFREDLYYRLCDFTIVVPPLRERKEDILYLAKRFLDSTQAELGRNNLRLSESAVKALVSYEWSGNVRELKSVMRRAALMSTDMISEADMGIEAQGKTRVETVPEDSGLHWKGSSLKDIVQRSVTEVERRVLMGVLEYTGGNKAKAARLLQIDYKTMHTKVKKFGIETKGEDDE
jgi:two-component system nitrogen regulation response regulator GlnG